MGVDAATVLNPWHQRSSGYLSQALDPAFVNLKTFGNVICRVVGLVVASAVNLTLFRPAGRPHKSIQQP